MPHLIIEYSSNLRTQIDPQRFVDRLHDAAVATGEFPPMSLRTRAAERTHFKVGDGRARNAFVHITLRIRPGREPEIKRRLGETVFNAACDFLRPVFDASPLGLTLEVQDIDVEFRFLRNNMADFWAAADAPAPAKTG